MLLQFHNLIRHLETSIVTPVVGVTLSDVEVLDKALFPITWDALSIDNKLVKLFHQLNTIVTSCLQHLCNGTRWTAAIPNFILLSRKYVNQSVTLIISVVTVGGSPATGAALGNLSLGQSNSMLMSRLWCSSQAFILAYSVRKGSPASFLTDCLPTTSWFLSDICLAMRYTALPFGSTFIKISPAEVFTNHISCRAKCLAPW